MKTRTLPKAVAYSLGAHGLALALIVMANANGVTPRQTIENVPFITASLIYAMNGQDDQKTPPPVHRTTDRTVRTVNKPMEPRPAVNKVNDKEMPETTVTEGVRAEQARRCGNGCPRVAASAVFGKRRTSDRSRPAVKHTGNHLHTGPQGGSGKSAGRADDFAPLSERSASRLSAHGAHERL